MPACGGVAVRAAGDDVVGSVYAATHAALHVLQRWLAGSQAGTLVVLTQRRGGVAR